MRQVDENIKSFHEFYQRYGDRFHKSFFQNYNDCQFISFTFTFDVKYYHHFHNFIKYYFGSGDYEIIKKRYGKTTTFEFVCRCLNKTRYYEKFVVPVNEIEKTDGSNLRKQILLAFEEQNFNIENFQPSPYSKPFLDLWFFSQGFMIQGKELLFLKTKTKILI